MALKTVRDHATETLSLALEVGSKVSEVNVSLSKVPTSDIIHLNKETRDILNARLLKATIQLSKSEESKAKTSNLLRKSIVEIKSLQSQINILQKEAIKMEGSTQKGSLVQKMLDDRDKEIQTLKKKLRVPVTQLAQADELDDFKKEKEALKSELIDCKDKLLNLEEKGRQWEADIQLLRNSKAKLKAKLATKESELKSRNTEKAI